VPGSRRDVEEYGKTGERVRIRREKSAVAELVPAAPLRVGSGKMVCRYDIPAKGFMDFVLAFLRGRRTSVSRISV
jgi:hypothetical protein